MNQSLKNFMTVTSKDQLRFLDAVVMRFVDRMDEVVGGQLKNFGRGARTDVPDPAGRLRRDPCGHGGLRGRLARPAQRAEDLRGDGRHDERLLERPARQPARGAGEHAQPVRRRRADGSRRAPADELSQDRQRHAGGGHALSRRDDRPRSTASSSASPRKTPPPRRRCRRRPAS